MVVLLSMMISMRLIYSIRLIFCWCVLRIIICSSVVMMMISVDSRIGVFFGFILLFVMRKLKCLFVNMVV